MYLTTVILIIMIHFQANLQNKLKQAPAIAFYYGSPKKYLNLSVIWVWCVSTGCGGGWTKLACLLSIRSRRLDWKKDWTLNIKLSKSKLDGKIENGQNKEQLCPGS